MHIQHTHVYLKNCYRASKAVEPIISSNKFDVRLTFPSASFFLNGNGCICSVAPTESNPWNSAISLYIFQLFHHGTSILAMCLLPPKRASKFGGPQAAEHVVFWHTFDGWNPYIKTNWVTKKKRPYFPLKYGLWKIVFLISWSMNKSPRNWVCSLSPTYTQLHTVDGSEIPRPTTIWMYKTRRK